MHVLHTLTKSKILPRLPIIVQSCNAGTGIKGTTRNSRRPNKNRQRGWRVQDGDTVHNGYLLATQNLYYKWYPGANVVAGRKKTLTATCSGTIRFTKEIMIPGRKTKLGAAVKHLPEGALIYRSFINVIPSHKEGYFKLVEQI